MPDQRRDFRRRLHRAERLIAAGPSAEPEVVKVDFDAEMVLDPDLLPATLRANGLNIADLMSSDGTIMIGGDKAQYLATLKALQEAKDMLRRRREPEQT